MVQEVLDIVLLMVLLRLLKKAEKILYVSTQFLQNTGNLNHGTSWHVDLMSQPYNYFGFRKNGIVKAMVSENRSGNN